MTRLLFLKLLRDVQTIWDRIVLMIFALCITLMMFSTILYTWGITGREMPRAYLSTSPASATLVLEQGMPLNEMAALVAQAHQQPNIIATAARDQLTLQVQQKNGEWGPNPLQIFIAAPDDPMQIETFTVEQGTWPPAAGEILIDRSSFELLNLQVGQDVVVQAPTGAPVALRISGVVYAPGLAPSFQEQKGHGFMSTASLPLLGQPLVLDALKIQVADPSEATMPSRDRDDIVSTSLDLAQWVQQTYDVSVREIQIPTPYAHPHQAQADSLLLGLLAFGAAGLVLSAILIATMLNGLLTQHVPQIGIMKAIGARSGRILQFYLLMTLVIAVAATAIAFVPGIFLSRSLTPIILKLLGVDAESLAAPVWMYGLVLIAGIGVPLLFALASLIKTSRTTVREALDYRGVDRRGDFSTRFDAGLGRLPWLDRTILLAFRNIFRRRARFLLSVGLLAFAGAVFIAGMSTMFGFEASLERDKALRQWDVDVRLAVSEDAPSVALSDLVANIPDVARVEEWSSYQTSIIPTDQQISVTRTYPDQGHGSIAVAAIPADSALITPPPLLDGRWLQPDEIGAVVVSKAGLSEDAPEIHSGDTIQMAFGGRITSWQVVGIAETVGGHGGGIFITRAGLEAATGINQPNMLRIVTETHEEATRTTVANVVEQTLKEAGIVVRSSASVSVSDEAGAGHMLPLILVFLGLSIAISIVGFAGLTSTMSTNVLERTREFGVMSAIGASTAVIRRLIVLEGIFIAVASCVIGAVPALVLTAAMIAYLPMPMDLPFQLSGRGILIWIVVVIIGSVIATLAPAFRASRLTVREALTYL